MYSNRGEIDEITCNNECFDYFQISNNDILNTINKLDSNKTNSPDGIPAIFYVNTVHAISKPLHIIFNRSLTEMNYPEQWKTSFVSPIHKSGDTDNIENYRPISILSAAAKIFDKLIYAHLISKTSHLITQYQHGFTTGKSTLTNLLEFTDYLSKNMMKGGQVDTIYMDLAKAFDKIDHNMLLDKLKTLPLSSCMIKLLSTYLSGRKQIVCVYGEKSEGIIPLSSVPQPVWPTGINLFVKQV